MKYRKSFFILNIIMFVFQAWGLAQEIPKHELKVYESPDGKLFWPKDLPVYIRLSPTKEANAENFLLKSEATAKFADPFYLDTEGINYLRSQWAVDPKTKTTVYPQTEVVWEVYRDGIPPVSNIQYNQQAFKGKNKIYSTPGLQVILEANDALSGVETIMYSINQSPYEKYTIPLILTDEKEYELKYYSVDNVGNTEVLKAQIIIIDKTPPKSRYAFIGDSKENIISSRVKMELASEDDFAGLDGIYYRIDEQTEKKYTSPIFFDQLKEGEHDVVFYAVDNLGQKEEEQHLQLYIDNTPPIITADLLGESYIVNGKEYSSSRSRLQLTSIDNKSGVKSIYYSINNGEYKQYDAPFFLSGAQGDLKISYYAVDHVGNKSSSATGKESVSMSYLDLTGPLLSYNLQGPRFFSRDTIFISNQTKIELKGVDNESGLKKITYTINNSSEIDYNNPFTLQEEGIYNINYYGFDNVINSSKNSLCLVVDKEGPEIFPILSNKPIAKKNVGNAILNVFPEHVILFLSATDSQAGYETMSYSINQGKSSEYIYPVKGFKKGETYHFNVVARDKLGNSKIGDLKFVIEE